MKITRLSLPYTDDPSEDIVYTESGATVTYLSLDLIILTVGHKAGSGFNSYVNSFILSGDIQVGTSDGVIQLGSDLVNGEWDHDSEEDELILYNTSGDIALKISTDEVTGKRILYIPAAAVDTVSLDIPTDTEGFVEEVIFDSDNIVAGVPNINDDKYIDTQKRYLK